MGNEPRTAAGIQARVRRKIITGAPERILGQRLRGLREEAGMTQAQLAERMSAQGFSMRQSAIAKIEANQRPVRVNEAVMLAGILDIPLPWLLADPELDEDAAALWDELRQVTTARLEVETERAALQADIAKARQRLSEAGRRWNELDSRERELQGQWLIARRRAGARPDEGN